ncbi:MAG: CDP-6-deoxy-delta-3,4-glucoseen reductase [Leucothrix sp.]
MSYKVTILPSNHAFEIADNETVLDAALRNGLMFPYSCRGGSCGTCFGKVLAGDIAFPDGLPLGLMASDQAQGQALFCCAVAKSDLTIDVREVRSRDEVRVKTLPAQVKSLNRLAADVMEVRLALPASESLPFRAGQYIDFLLRHRKRRAFSIANAPNQDGILELHIRLVPGGEFTERVFNQFQIKSLVRIEAPLGDFYIREASNRPLLMIAGGTGFAPIKAMIEQLRLEQDTRPIHLYWGARTLNDLYHQSLAQSWITSGQFYFTPVLSQPTATDRWQGRQGYVHEAVAADYPNLTGFDVYIAGPPQMIVAAQAQFLKQGLPREQLFCDAFEYAQD